jgi:dihydropteroate synthase
MDPAPHDPLVSGRARQAAAFPARPWHSFCAGSCRIPLGQRSLVMGVLNCTPDSFSDGGRYVGSEAIARRLEEIAEQGGDWCDIGGESTRPGAVPVSASEEWSRVAPALREARKRNLPLVLSIDTTKAEVARRALEEGAVIVNDVSGLRFDPAMAEVAASARAGVILMHMRGEPRTMQQDPVYENLITEVSEFLKAAAEGARAAGISPESILCDPGIGFGKTVEHNLELIRRLPEMAEMGYPLLVGASRKSFLGRVLDLPVDERLEASLAAHVAAVLAGAHVVRAHDVGATVRAVRVADAIRG